MELLSERLHALDADSIEEDGDRFQCFRFDEELASEVNQNAMSDSESDSDDSGVNNFTLQQIRSQRWRLDSTEGEHLTSSWFRLDLLAAAISIQSLLHNAGVRADNCLSFPPTLPFSSASAIPSPSLSKVNIHKQK